MIFSLVLDISANLKISNNKVLQLGQLVTIKYSEVDYTIVTVPRRYVSNFDDGYEGSVTSVRFIVPGYLNEEERANFLQEQINNNN